MKLSRILARKATLEALRKSPALATIIPLTIFALCAVIFSFTIGILFYSGFFRYVDSPAVAGFKAYVITAFIAAILSLFIGYGLWKLKTWARHATLFFLFLGAAIDSYLLTEAIATIELFPAENADAEIPILVTMALLNSLLFIYFCRWEN